MFDTSAWFESVKNQPLSLWEPATEEEEDEGFDLDLDPPVLGLKDTPSRLVMQIEADYEDTEADREEDEGPYDEEAVRLGYEEHYQKVFEEQVAQLSAKYGEAARDVDGGEPPPGLDPALFRHADYWQVANWTIQDRHLLVLYAMWIGDGTYSLAIHAIVARKQSS